MNNATPAYYTIHDLPTETRPRERLIRLGAGALNDAELLAVILRSGAKGVNVVDMATDLLRAYKGLAGLARASFDDLQEHHGMGRAKATQILATIELGRRIIQAELGHRIRITSPDDVARLLQAELAYAEQEHIKIVLIDSRNHVLATPTVYKGTLNSAHARIGELFREAIRRNAAAIIVAHNHPSGDPTPSPEDVAFTRKLVEAAQLLQIDVLDHLIIGHQRFVSLKQRGVVFK